MDLKQVVVVRTDLGMGRGKIAAQCAHASIGAMEKITGFEPGWVSEWKEEGQAKIVLKIDSEKEMLTLFQKIKKKFPCALIKDAGKTQIKSGTATCFGVGPVPEKAIDEFIKDLKLL